MVARAKKKPERCLIWVSPRLHEVLAELTLRHWDNQQNVMDRVALPCLQRELQRMRRKAESRSAE